MSSPGVSKLLRQYKVGQRVQSLDTPATKGSIVRVRKKARTVIGVQWVDVLLDKDSPDPATGKVITSVNSCWKYEDEQLPWETHKTTPSSPGSS